MKKIGYTAMEEALHRAVKTLRTASRPVIKTLAVVQLVLAGCIVQACQDEDLLPSASHGQPLKVEEGIAGELTLTLGADFYEKQQVSTRNTPDTQSDQHVHSAYLFIIDRKDADGNTAHAECPIIARKYFSDITSTLTEVEVEGKKVQVSQVTIPAVTCQNAQIFAIVNLGFSNVQGIANDSELLKLCDDAQHLEDLHTLTARLGTNNGEVNVERMQGHHLMSGYFRTAKEHHYLVAAHKRPLVTISNRKDAKPDGTEGAADGKLQLYDAKDGSVKYCPLGVAQAGYVPSAVFVHRLDTKITVKIQLDGALKEARRKYGAFFRLTSWQVCNAPTQQYVCWRSSAHAESPIRQIRNSKVFQRDLTEDADGGWEFTYYQFENYTLTGEVDPSLNAYKQKNALDAAKIATQYNWEYGLKDASGISEETVKSAFANSYPNKYSNFAYGLRELKEKSYAYGGHKGDEYDPAGDQDNDTITVVNGNFANAPDSSTYVRLTGIYYNPQEPARREKDDPRSLSYEKTHPISQFPYWGEGQIPVPTETEALKRTRSATVIYYVHLGYVGGGNSLLNMEQIETGEALKDFGKFQKKLNDYNVLRNHHYTYTLKVAGVENIKLEATREDGGNIYGQEIQPGAEGQMLESQHFLELDAHYEARNFTLDFERMPQDLDLGFEFGLETPFQKQHAYMKRKEDQSVGIFDKMTGQEITSVRNRDIDWIHFVWHGQPIHADNPDGDPTGNPTYLSHPDKSLIDSQTGNGIAYSQTYGGYDNQQSYLAGKSVLTHGKDADHPYYLMNAHEFATLVWEFFSYWKAHKEELNWHTMTFTVFVDEYYYDFNPVTNAKVDWTAFSNQPKRRAVFFMEPNQVSADSQNWYADAHLAIFQQSIQTLYATSNQGGQNIAEVAFGIEGMDEYRAQYAADGTHSDDGEWKKYSEKQFFEADGSTADNGLYNTMLWYNNHRSDPSRVPDWTTAASSFTEKAREYVPASDDYTNTGKDGRSKRHAQWAVYSRNRDLNRDGVLNADEIRWFTPAIDQYTLCFLGGRPVFENPLFEKGHSVTMNTYLTSWLQEVPVLHFMSSTTAKENQIFWAEEGCSKGNYGAGKAQCLYGIRMARMLCKHGVTDTGKAFSDNMNPDKLQQDPLFIVSASPNGAQVPYDERVNGQNYYILLNKMNINAFRDPVGMGELSSHTHEQKQNWLSREYVIAKNRLGYTSYTDKNQFDRTPKSNGTPRSWYQMTGYWSPDSIRNDIVGNEGLADSVYYRGAQESVAYAYYEKPDGTDLHRWRVPNLREAAIMTMAFNNDWFFPAGADVEHHSITANTQSDNTGPQSSIFKFWILKSNQISRMPGDGSKDSRDYRYYMRPVRDVQ